MADVEKVIAGLTMIADRKNDDSCEGLKCCNIAEDALELLKEQEAKIGHWIYRKYDDMFMCSFCEKYSIRNDYPYCHWCGVKMEQEDR